MPDGRRKRRFSLNQTKRQWYAAHRARRFAHRFFGLSYPDSAPQAAV